MIWIALLMQLFASSGEEANEETVDRSSPPTPRNDLATCQKTIILNKKKKTEKYHNLRRKPVIGML